MMMMIDKKGYLLNTDRYYQYINNIIDTRGQGSISNNIYCECHHIIFKCFGGEGSSTRSSRNQNIVQLTAGEHYVAHKIMAEDNPNDYSCLMAYSMMAFPKGKTDRNPLTPEEYGEARKLISGCKHVLTEEHLQHIREAGIRKRGKYKGIPKSDEHKEKIKQSNLGKKHNISEEGKKSFKAKIKQYWETMDDEDYTNFCAKQSKLASGLLGYIDLKGNQFRSKEIIKDPDVKKGRVKTGKSNSNGRGATNGVLNVQIQGNQLPMGYKWGVTQNKKRQIRITNGKENRNVSNIFDIPDGGGAGLSGSYNYRQNKILINNGEKEFYINDNIALPAGCFYGRIKRIYITNGKKNLRIKISTPIPSGGWKGRTIQKNEKII